MKRLAAVLVALAATLGSAGIGVAQGDPGAMCKNGGYVVLNFKNQGQCVSRLARSARSTTLFVDLDMGANSSRFGVWGMDCGIAPGDEWEWTYLGQSVGVHLAAISRNTATWYVYPPEHSPWANLAPRDANGNVVPSGSRSVRILGVNLTQRRMNSHTDDPRWLNPPRVTEVRVPHSSRPHGWMTCTLGGLWFSTTAGSSEWFARSIPDWHEFSGLPAVNWVGTVDVWIDGGIPHAPPLQPLRL